MTLPQLPRQPIRPKPLEDDLGKEIWQPTWDCYCCHDTGLVRGLLVLLVIPDYNDRYDKPVACQRSGCQPGLDYCSIPYYDQRFNSDICAELDKISRQDWEQTVLDQYQLAKNRAAIQTYAQTTSSLRSRSRTLEENSEAQRRSEEIKAGRRSAEEEGIT